jgi:hypothetical protein
VLGIDGLPGRGIIAASWVGNLLFAGTAIPAALGVEALDAPAIATALLLFFVSLGIWTWAFVVALSRNAAGDDIAVASLFGTIGGASRPVKWHLFGSFGVCVAITALTASADPFGTLVPMLPLGFVGLWAARHGTFPPRRATVPRRA